MALLERISQAVRIGVGGEGRAGDEREQECGQAEAAERVGSSASYGRASRRSARSDGVRRPLNVPLRWERSRQTSTSWWIKGQGS